MRGFMYMCFWSEVEGVESWSGVGETKYEVVSIACVGRKSRAGGLHIGTDVDFVSVPL